MLLTQKRVSHVLDFTNEEAMLAAVKREWARFFDGDVRGNLSDERKQNFWDSDASRSLPCLRLLRRIAAVIHLTEGGVEVTLGHQKHMVPKKRNRLGPDIIQAMMRLKENSDLLEWGESEPDDDPLRVADEPDDPRFGVQPVE